MSVTIPVLKKYSVIYTDCPWDYKRKGGPKHIGMAYQVYPTLSDEDVYGLNIRELSAEDCFLFYWSTWPKMEEAITAIKGWGFRYVTAAFVWVKTNKKNQDTLAWGLGHYSRANTEVCLLGIKGKPKVIYHGVHQVVWDDSLEEEMFPSEVKIPRYRHSEKPEEVRTRIVRLCGDVPRIELFARRISAGWDTWGDELFD